MKIRFIDHLNREVFIPENPQRIISLCPSQTETLFALGLADRIVGRTHFCIHPNSEILKIKRIGGTKTVNIENVRELKPDLIIGEKEENTAELIEALEKEFPVYVTEVQDKDSAMQMIYDLGSICGVEKKASILLKDVHVAFETLRTLPVGYTCAYLIWREPYMAVANHTYIQSMLEACGFENVFRDYPARYPEISAVDLELKNPNYILLSSEPYPFKEKHIKEILQILPKAKIILVDGEMFSWYGSRMTKATDYFNNLLLSLPAPLKQ